LHVGAGYSYGRSLLTFGSGAGDATLFQQAASASIEWRATDDWTLSAALGGVLAGSFSIEGQTFSLRPGASIGFGASRPLLSPTNGRPFVLMTFGLSGALASIRDDSTGNTASLSSIDGRVGVVAGKAFGPVAPFAFARIFGGPVFTTVAGTSIVGGDQGHYQVGLGVAVSLGAGLDLFVEGAPLGERRIAGGLGIRL
jgi:hypothetical protein